MPNIAEVGILLLLFEIGLETDVGQIIKVGLQSTFVAVTGVVVPGLFGFWAGYYVLELPWFRGEKWVWFLRK